MKRILIVEDNAVISSIYVDMYRLAGFDVATAADGETGLQQVAEFKPDLLHLDLLIPKVDGLEVTRRVRALPECADMPILILSVSYAPGAVDAALKLGATECLSKAKCSPKAVVAAACRLLATRTKSVPPAAPDAAPPAQATVAAPPDQSRRDDG
jgi:CheY-like chemotaxis protein